MMMMEGKENERTKEFRYRSYSRAKNGGGSEGITMIRNDYGGRTDFTYMRYEDGGGRGLGLRGGRLGRDRIPRVRE